jgi:methylase of polypeptide subunit release factors
LGIIGAHEWRRRGIPVPALDARIYPHYGVYAPWRLEYVDLLAQACKTWPVEKKRAVDVGTGTGVLAFVLARNGARVVATDLSPRAVTCATENAAALGLLGQVEVRSADLLPGERFDLAVANPPWIPSEAHTPLDHAIYDPGGRFLKALVTGLDGALLPDGEAFLLLSDLAERLGLRKEGHLAALAKESGFTIQGELEASPTHKRSQDPDDPLHEARKAEVVRLFRLVRSS